MDDVSLAVRHQEADAAHLAMPFDDAAQQPWRHEKSSRLDALDQSFQFVNLERNLLCCGHDNSLRKTASGRKSQAQLIALRGA